MPACQSDCLPACLFKFACQSTAERFDWPKTRDDQVRCRGPPPHIREAMPSTWNHRMIASARIVGHSEPHRVTIRQYYSTVTVGPGYYLNRQASCFKFILGSGPRVPRLADLPPLSYLIGPAAKENFSLGPGHRDCFGCDPRDC